MIVKVFSSLFFSGQIPSAWFYNSFVLSSSTFIILFRQTLEFFFFLGHKVQKARGILLRMGVHCAQELLGFGSHMDVGDSWTHSLSWHMVLSDYYPDFVTSVTEDTRRQASVVTGCSEYVFSSVTIWDRRLCSIGHWVCQAFRICNLHGK
jgi:hypothetical protein